METFHITPVNGVNTLPEFLVRRDGTIICSIFTDAIGGPKHAVSYIPTALDGRTFVHVEAGDRMIRLMQYKPFLRKQVVEITVYRLDFITPDGNAHFAVETQYKGHEVPSDSMVLYKNDLTLYTVAISIMGMCCVMMAASNQPDVFQHRIYSISPEEVMPVSKPVVQPLSDESPKGNRWDSLEV